MLAPALTSFRGQYKPPGIPRINWEHPLAQGLLFYGYDAGGFHLDLAGGRKAVNQGARPGFIMGPEGAGALWNDNGGSGTGPLASFNSDAAIQNATAAGNYTWACAFRKTGTVGQYTRPFCRTAENGGSNPYLNWNFEINTAGAGQNAIISQVNLAGSFAGIWTWNSGWSDNQYVTVGASFNYTPSLSYGVMWGNGAQVGSSGTGWGTGAPGSDNTGDGIVFAGANPTGANGSFAGYVYYGAFWNRILSDQEHALLHADPYCFLIYPDQELGVQTGFVGSSAGIPVFRDYSAAIELGASIARNVVMLVDPLGSLARDQSSPSSADGGVQASVTAQIENGQGVRQDYSAPAEFGAGVHGDLSGLVAALGILVADMRAPIEMGTQTLADASFPGEAGASVRADVAVPADRLAMVRADQAVQLGVLASLFVDQRAALEFGQAVALQITVPVEFAGSGNSVVSDVGVSIEWVAGVQRDTLAPIERGAAVTATANLLAAVMASLAIAAPVSVETVQQARRDLSAAVEYIAGLIRDQQVPAAFSVAVFGDIAVQVEFDGAAVSIKIASFVFGGISVGAATGGPRSGSAVASFRAIQSHMQFTRSGVVMYFRGAAIELPFTFKGADGTPVVPVEAKVRVRFRKADGPGWDSQVLDLEDVGDGVRSAVWDSSVAAAGTVYWSMWAKDGTPTTPIVEDGQFTLVANSANPSYG